MADPDTSFGHQQFHNSISGREAINELGTLANNLGQKLMAFASGALFLDCRVRNMVKKLGKCPLS